MNFTVDGGTAVVAEARPALVSTDALDQVLEPEGIVLHYTAGHSAESTIQHLRTVGLSYHLIVDRDGTVWQCTPLNRKAWHAGQSNWRGRSGCNHWTIGIAFANLGLVKAHPPHSNLAGTATFAKHRNGKTEGLWEHYTPEQVKVGAALVRAIRSVWPIPMEDIFGHDDCAGFRGKIDPGPLWPWQAFRQLVTQAAAQPLEVRVAELEANQTRLALRMAALEANK